MDSQKRTTIWAALAISIAVVMGIPGWLMVGFWFWSRWYPDPTKEPDIMMPLMTGWLPIVMVSVSSILSAVMLLTVAVKWLRNRHLTSEVKRLRNDVANLKGERQTAWDKATEAAKAVLEADRRALEDKESKNATYTALTECKRQLADWETLRQIRAEQASDIKGHVVLTKVEPGKLVVNTDGSVCIFLVLAIRNESLFDITIHHENVKGCLVREGRAFRSPIAMIVDLYRLPIENLRPFQPAIIYLEQPLIDFEVELIDKSLNAANARVSLANLIVPISVGDGSQVKTKDLRITPEQEYATFEDCRKTNDE